MDVTKAPYFADNTGKEDCTRILVAILDDLLRVSLEGMERVMKILEASTEDDVVLPGSFENRRQNGRIFGVFPDGPPPARILYFPRGVYLVSDTVCYSFDNLRNGLGTELDWGIRFQGECREETVIRLQDRCPGFEYGMNRPVVAFIRGRRSNIAMTNFFRDLTIDIGTGNPGAVGLDFMGNNCAGVSDVTIRTSDPAGRGQTGLSVSRGGASGCVFKRVTVEGFDEGIAVTGRDNYVIFDDVQLRNQTQRGFTVGADAVVCIRGLSSENRQPALSVKGTAAHVVVTDSSFLGGAEDAPAIEFALGHLFVRSLRTTGYRCAIGLSYTPGWGTDPVMPACEIDEYVSDPVCTLSDGQSTRSLNLRFERAPEPAWDTDHDAWVHPGSFGALGDAIHDDTAAVQSAMDSGNPVVYFQPGRYVIDAPIRVPASVRWINFMFADLIAGPNLREMVDSGMFTVVGETEHPLVIEDLHSFEMNFGHHYLVDHASTRTLNMRNLHLQSCAAYRNSVPGGTVFLENIVSTTGIFNDTYRQPCFAFRGQTAWCIQLDPEYTPDKVINDASTLGIIGFKTEGEGIAFSTLNGGRTEILGGILLFGGNNDVPAVLNDASDVAFIGSTTGTTSRHVFRVAVRESDGVRTNDALHSQFPVRYHSQFVVPLYVGRMRPQAP